MVGDLKLYCLGIGVFCSVIADSRLTIARSASDSTGAIGASIPVGFDWSLLRNAPSKWMSPPNANVTACPFPRRGSRNVVVVGGRVEVVVVEVEVTATAFFVTLSERSTAAATVPEARPAASTPATRTRRRVRRRRAVWRMEREEGGRAGSMRARQRIGAVPCF